ncbi:MAG: sulfate adenylyltransferase subunit CysN [Kiritimatiellaeota bacterium]|nr:sulfate adenylyltransferase subunit CysN [Kiritimatiellota bacterium]
MDIEKFLDQHENKDLLRFLTSGSVDDGKSTLIGRLLYDSKLIFEDQLSTLRKDSDRIGTTHGTGEIDYALLLDGLKAEREQGITIDVAYRYFATPNRKFIIADTPGHEQYTRNMATGASTANLAIILIDARHGVVTQTKRHAFIISLLGIKHAIVAVNKMDIVDYSQNVFHDIQQDFRDFIAEVEIPDIHYIPVSALKGDNVVDPSANMAWYDGKTLLETLESVNISHDRNFTDFRFPVQFVNRPNLDFRGFSGTVASGIVKRGDRIKALPSMRTSRIKRIVTADGDLEEAFVPQAITLVLEDEIDVSSGEMMVLANNVPRIATHFEAIVVWMADTPLRSSDEYIIRQAGQLTQARIDSLKYHVDVNTLNKSKADTLRLNEIGRVVVSTSKPLFYDSYSKNRATGAFILIDPVTNGTACAGMIIEGLSPKNLEQGDEAGSALVEHVQKREFQWDTGMVSNKERTIKNRHKGKLLVVTGLKGVGKHEVAKKLESRLFKLNMNSYYLGVGNVLGGLDADMGDAFWDHDEHIRRIGELSRIMTDAGLILITPINNADDYDLEKLKMLNSPNELIVVNIGENIFENYQVDVNLDSNPDLASSLTTILRLLSDKKIIPDYCI